VGIERKGNIMKKEAGTSELVQKAVKFLISGDKFPVAFRLAYLRSKGLTDEQITEALLLAGAENVEGWM
jgi:hypothetical protein